MDHGDEGCLDGGGGVAVLRVTEAAHAASSPGLDAGATAAAVLARAGVRERQVFVLGADGSYDVKLNRFFRELDAWGVRAASSVRAYARDIAVFCRFLEQARGGKSIWECDASDLAAFKRVRLHADPEQAVSVSTWRRSIAALDKWAAWARYEGLIGELPFRYEDKTVWTPNGLQRIRVNAASEPDPGPAPVRFLAFEDYLVWRDVGLAGRLPGVSVGKLDPLTRRRLTGITGSGELTGPLALWLGDDGLPLHPAAWQAVFTRANERCAGFGLEMRATPHMLRHSFAVHMLGLLLRQTVAALGEARTAGTLTSAQVKRLLVGNPMRKLQLLLGHRNEATVYTYLDVLDEAQEIVALALEQWETQASALDQLDDRPGRGQDDDGRDGSDLSVTSVTA